MPEKQVYEYAVIRLVPRVEREEFVNTGLIMCSRLGKYIRMQYEIVPEKIAGFVSELDMAFAAETLKTYQLIAEGNPEGGSIATLDLIERFRWITAVKSTCIQTSPARTGLSDDPDTTFNRLYDELVR